MCKNCGQGGKCGCMCVPARIAKWILIIGGLNWGLIGVGAFIGENLNVINRILSGAPMIEWAIYVLVGVSAVVKIIGCRCKSCGPEQAGAIGGMTGGAMK